ncbi:hypothetical protein BKA69DRAFT_1119871, partial [Paraphysoderma sedebokerense]
NTSWGEGRTKLSVRQWWIFICVREARRAKIEVTQVCLCARDIFRGDTAHGPPC